MFAQAYADTGEPALQGQGRISWWPSWRVPAGAGRGGRDPATPASSPPTRRRSSSNWSRSPRTRRSGRRTTPVTRSCAACWTRTCWWATQQALDVVTRMGDWVHSRLSVLPRATLNRMWAIYIAGENGAMNEVMADLYALTGQQRHLAAAMCFDNRQSLFGACVENRDTSPGCTPTRTCRSSSGTCGVFDQSREEEYAAAAGNFWRMVVPHADVQPTAARAAPGRPARPARTRTRAVPAPRQHRRSIGGNGAETCTTYNLLKLSRQPVLPRPGPGLHGLLRARPGQPHPRLPPRRRQHQQPERHVLPVRCARAACAGSATPAPAAVAPAWRTTPSTRRRSTSDPPTHARSTSTCTSPRCCTWPEKGFVIEQATDYPAEGASTLTFRDGRGRLDIKLRVPAWARRLTVTVNGVRSGPRRVPGSYLTVSRNWRPGDRVGISRLSAADRKGPGRAGHPVGVLRAGAAARTERGNVVPVVLVLQGLHAARRPLRRDRARRPAAALHHPRADPRPLYVGDNAPSTPTSSARKPSSCSARRLRRGQPRPRRRLTFLDALWEQAPFATSGRFVRAVRTLADTWLSEGLFSRAERDGVIAAAVRADLRRGE